MSEHRPQPSPHPPTNRNGHVPGRQESRRTKRRDRPLGLDLRELHPDLSATATLLDNLVDATSCNGGECCGVADRDDAIQASAIAPVAVFLSIGDAVQRGSFWGCSGALS